MLRKQSGSRGVTRPGLPVGPGDSYLRELFESADVGVLIADDAAFYIDANRAACRIFGRPRSDLIGHHLSEFIEGARAADVDAQWKSFLRDTVQSGVFSVLLPDGSSQSFRFHARTNLVAGLHCSFLSPMPLLADAPDKHALLTVCAWTKRVLFRDQWLSMEEYLEIAHGILVTHGMCPDAFSALSKKGGPA